MKLKSVSIVAASGYGGKAKVMGTLEGSDEQIEVFEYFDDEISFTEAELIGLTVGQALGLRQSRDIEYLKS